MVPRQQWVPDSKVTHCSLAGCGRQFSLRLRRHHCRRCGLVFCGEHSSHRVQIGPGADAGPKPPEAGPSSDGAPAADEGQPLVRVCDACFEKLHHPVAIPEGLLHDPGDGDVVSRNRTALFVGFRSRFNEAENEHIVPVIQAYQRVRDLPARQRDKPVVAWEPDKPVRSPTLWRYPPSPQQIP